MLDPDRPEFNVGDLVWVVVDGSYVFGKPVRIRNICERDGQAWAFVDGSEAGVPVDSLTAATDADTAQDATAKAQQEQVGSPNADAMAAQMTAALPPIAKIAELLGGDVQGGQVRCPGPGHSANDRSLSVKPDPADREGFVTHSFAGDDWKACRDHVRRLLGLPEPKSEPQQKTGGGKWSVLGEYVYFDQNGERFLKVRKCRDGTGKKQFPQYHWDGNAWAKGKPHGSKIPYRLPNLIATPITAQVYFCEGEKDADTLAKIGFVATTASEGAAAKWDLALTPYFKDRHVVILPDADRPGRAHAQKVAKAIHGVAASVRILDLYPERHDGSDVSDFIAHDTAGVRLAEAVKEAPLWGPRGPAASAGAAADGAELLADVHAFLGRFVAYPSDHAHVAHALWIAHAHAMEAWDSTPRIAFLSPEPGSGKTRALEVSELLVPNPVEAVNVTPAYLFRKVGAEEGPPTILYDEIDTVFGPKAKDNEEIRGLLNAGHRRGAVAGRCVVRGKTVETEEISAYCAVALAGLGWLPDTLMSRSIVIRMRRRAPTETIEPYRRRDEIDEGHELRGRLAGWAAAKGKILCAARPALPPGIEDRNADVWEALFAVADAAGGDWPKLARDAAVALIAAGREQEPSLGIRLLADLRTVFGKTESFFTEAILTKLHAMEEAPWKDLNNGKALDSRGLGLRLRQYSIKSKQIRDGATTKKGYQRADLADAWARYLPSPQTSETSETAETSQDSQGPNVSGVSDNPPNVSDEASNVSDSPPDVSLNGGPKSPTKSTRVSDVSDVSLLADHERRKFDSVNGGGPVCAHCGRPGGNEVFFSDAQSGRLHRECEDPYRCALDGHGQAGSLADKGRLPASSPFRVIGSAPPGSVCVWCFRDEGELVLKIAGSEAGAKSETLHENCAGSWFAALRNHESQPDDNDDHYKGRIAPQMFSGVSDAGCRSDQADDIPTDQTCAQCNGTIDGTERMVSVSGHTVWLHETCERFWRAVVAGER